MLERIKQLQKTQKIERLENPPIGVPRYTINNQGYYSVTQILDDGSFSMVDPNVMIHALTLGSVVHLQIENFLKNLDLKHNLESTLESKQLQLYNFLTEAPQKEWEMYLNSVREDRNLEEVVLKNRIKSAFDQFMNFYSNHEVEVIFAEEVIWDPDYLFAGTIDLVAKVDGELCIIDHKTSRFVDPSISAEDKYTAQLSAYTHAIKNFSEDNELEINLNILHLNPIKESYTFIKRNYNFDLFLHAMTRFSREKRSHHSIENGEEIKEKDIKALYTKKSFPCPAERCKQDSEFPFLSDLSFFNKYNVKKVIKVSFHEEENHFAIFQIKIPELIIEKSFIKLIT